MPISGIPREAKCGRFEAGEWGGHAGGVYLLSSNTCLDESQNLNASYTSGLESRCSGRAGTRAVTSRSAMKKGSITCMPPFP